MRIALALAMVMALQAQPSLRFESASIQPASPEPRMELAMGISGGPGTDNPGKLDYRNVPLKRILEDAYAVPAYQLHGRDWLDSKRFDIAAKVPAGATAEQARVMMQGLLQDRLGLVAHHEQRELAIYALTVAKGGLRMKPASDDPAPAPGFPRVLPGQMRMAAGPGPAGTRRVNARQQTMSDLKEYLRKTLGQPVVDETGLTAAFDFTLEYVPDKAPASEPDDGAAATPGEVPPNLFEALQKQLGLKLESKKAPFDVVVIDRIEKILR